MHRWQAHRAQRSLASYAEVQVGCYDLPVQTELPVETVDGYCKLYKLQDKGTCWFSGKGNTSEEDALSHKEHSGAGSTR